MEFAFERTLFENFPGLHVGVVLVNGIDNSLSSPGAEAVLLSTQARVRSTLDLPSLSSHPRIASWKAAYSAFGAKPSKYRCSVENLCRRVLDGKSVPSINALVDVYNAVSLSHVLPVGGDDLEWVQGDVRLCVAQGDERFLELNATEVKHPQAGEVIYRDDADVLCRRWNWRESDKTKTTPKTRKAVLYVEGLPPVTPNEVLAAARELADLVQTHCGGTASVHLVHELQPNLPLQNE